jgi:hypothetical protein
MSQNKIPERRIDAGRVNSHTIAKFLTLVHWRPERLAAIVPATPEDKTCVVLTGDPNASATSIVPIATRSAQATCL